MLAGYREHLNLTWNEVRSHPRLKEEVFEPFIEAHGDPRSAGGGREVLMRKTLSHYQTLLQLCPELAELQRRIRQALG